MITLELWMVVVLAVVFAYAMYDLYVAGYSKGFLQGGVHAHLFTMDFVKKNVSSEQLLQIREDIVKFKTDSET